MALPGGSDYDLFTLSNPSGALTDFTLIIDLSNCSADFKSNWNTDSNGYGRAAIHGSGTELACDWIDLDNASGTGLVRVLWSGTFAATGIQQLRLYPPNTGNAQYAAGDTYGSDNAYDANTWAYWPLHDGNDRTSNGYDLTAYGAFSFGGIAGLIGDCTEWNGINCYADCETNFNFSNDWSFSALANFNTGATDQALIASYDENQPLLWRDEFASGDRLGMFITGETTGYDTTTLNIATWYHCAVCVSSSSPIYSNGSSGGSGGDGAGLPAATYPRLGAWNGVGPGRLLDGKMQHAVLSTIQRSADWIAYESNQLKDNSTIIGTGSWQGGGAAAVPFGGIYGKVLCGSLGGRGV
jgi:hypothetical protein